MSDVQRCPGCARKIYARFVQRHPDVDGEYVIIYKCENVATHGEMFDCSHGCGELVLNPEQHYTSTAGMIGSGRWTCYPKKDDEDLQWLPK